MTKLSKLKDMVSPKRSKILLSKSDLEEFRLRHGLLNHYRILFVVTKESYDAWLKGIKQAYGVDSRFIRVNADTGEIEMISQDQYEKPKDIEG
jgi:hypothetical protein